MLRKIDIRYLYAIYCLAYPWKVKIGISDSPRRRARELKAELSRAKGFAVSVRVAIAMPLFFARTQESGLHRRLAFLSTTMPDHAGQTEWFRHANLATALAACLFVFVRFDVPFGWQEWLSTWLTTAALSAVFYPADAALIVIAVFLWEVRWIAAAVTAGVIWFT